MSVLGMMRVGVAALVATCSVAMAQGTAPNFPERPVRLAVPFPPGGGADSLARSVAEQLGQLWKQPVVIDNISGAGGGVAAANVARARPDGYSILFATHAMMAVNPYVYSKLPYDAFKDFAPVVKLSDAPLVMLVPANSPFNSLADVIRFAKEKPGVLNFGSGGVGTTQHLTAELFKFAAGIDMTHVPFRGNAQTVTALIANQVQLFFDNAQSATAQIKGGRIRGLGISSRARHPSLPNVPTVAETLPGFESTISYGMLVPAETPPAIINAINRDVNRVLREPAYAARIAADGTAVAGGTPEQFVEFLTRERAKWSQLAKQLNLRLD